MTILEYTNTKYTAKQGLNFTIERLELMPEIYNNVQIAVDELNNIFTNIKKTYPVNIGYVFKHWLDVLPEHDREIGYSTGLVCELEVPTEDHVLVMEFIRKHSKYISAATNHIYHTRSAIRVELNKIVIRFDSDPTFIDLKTNINEHTEVPYNETEDPIKILFESSSYYRKTIN